MCFPGIAAGTVEEIWLLSSDDQQKAFFVLSIARTSIDLYGDRSMDVIIRYARLRRVCQIADLLSSLLFLRVDN